MNCRIEDPIPILAKWYAGTQLRQNEYEIAMMALTMESEQRKGMAASAIEAVSPAVYERRFPQEPDDVNSGVLEVGTDGKGNVIVNHPDLQPDEKGCGHIVFSPRQARQFGNLMLKHSAIALKEWQEGGTK
jgi:hypothetical protein